MLAAGSSVAEQTPAPAAPRASAADAEPSETSLARQLYKRDVACPADDPAAPHLRGVLLEPGRELNPTADTLQPIVRDAQGGFGLATGTTMFSGGLWRAGTDILAARLDATLAPLWATVFGGPVSDTPVSMAATRDGGFAVISFTRSLWFSTLFRWLAKDEGAVLVSKYGADGRLEWVQHLTAGAQPGGLSIATLPEGGILVGGGALRENRFAGFLIRLTDAGEVQWARSVGPHHEDFVGRLEALPDGSVLASGSHRMERASPRDVWVARLAADASVAWARAYHGDSGGSVGLAFPLAGGGAIVIRSPDDVRGAPRSKVAVFAIESDGAVRWSRVLAFEERVTLSNFAEPVPGRLLLFGGSFASETVAGPIVVELDVAGEVVASRAIDVASMAARPGMRIFAGDEPVSVVRDHGDGFVVLGNVVAYPLDVAARLASGGSFGDLDPETRARVRLQVFLLRIGAGVPTGGCTRSVPVRASDQPLAARPLDLSLGPLPAGVLVPVPRANLGERSLR
jgi:hypothetical protein